MTNQTLAFSFIIQQDIPVKNLQPAIVKVYDYYETGEQETVVDPKKLVVFVIVLDFFLHYVAKASPNTQSSWLSLPKADIIGICHHTHYLKKVGFQTLAHYVGQTTILNFQFIQPLMPCSSLSKQSCGIKHVHITQGINILQSRISRLKGTQFF